MFAINPYSPYEPKYYDFLTEAFLKIANGPYQLAIPKIKAKYSKFFEKGKEDYKYLTELVMVLNHIGWLFWENKQEKKANVFFDLFEEARQYGYNNLKDKELSYFYWSLD